LNTFQVQAFYDKDALLHVRSPPMQEMLRSNSTGRRKHGLRTP